MPNDFYDVEHIISEKPFCSIFFQLPAAALKPTISKAAINRDLDHLSTEQIAENLQHYLDTYSVMSHQRVTIEEVTHVRNPHEPDYEFSPQYGAHISLIGESYAVDTATNEPYATDFEGHPLALYFEMSLAPELHGVIHKFFPGFDLGGEYLPEDSRDIHTELNDLLDSDDLVGKDITIQIDRFNKD